MNIKKITVDIVPYSDHLAELWVRTCEDDTYNKCHACNKLISTEKKGLVEIEDVIEGLERILQHAERMEK